MKRSGIRVLLAQGEKKAQGVHVRDTSHAHALSLRVQLDTSIALSSGTYLSETYLIVPVISQVGDTVVWPANAATPEFIPADVLKLATESRNGHPVVVGHPRDSTGEYISANDPSILERYAIGHVFNARYSDGRVKAEMWISRARAESLPDETLRTQALDAFDRISAGEIVEVSEGNYVVIEDEEGEHDGQEYSGRWVLAIPDHLAILADGVEGACSVANHGCGAPRVNASRESSPLGAGAVGVSGQPKGSVSLPLLASGGSGSLSSAVQPSKESITTMKKTNKSPFSTFAQRFMSFFRPEMSNNQLRTRLLAALRELEPKVSYITDEDPDAGTVFYCTTDYESWESYYWRRTFTLDADGMPTLNDDRISVEPVMRYEPVPGETTQDTSISVAESDSADSHSTCSCKKGAPTTMTFNRKEAIPRIAARHKLDLKVLEAADDTVLEKLDDPNTTTGTGAPADDKVKQDKTVPPNTGPDPRPDNRPVSDLVEVPAMPAKDTTKDADLKTEGAVTLADLQKLLAPISAQLATFAPIVANAQKAETERRDVLIAALKTASKFTEDQLKAMSTEHLVTLADSLSVLTPDLPSSFDYTGSRVIVQGGASGGGDKGAPPAPNMMSFIKANKGNSGNKPDAAN